MDFWSHSAPYYYISAFACRNLSLTCWYRSRFHTYASDVKCTRVLIGLCTRSNSIVWQYFYSFWHASYFFPSKTLKMTLSSFHASHNFSPPCNDMLDPGGLRCATYLLWWPLYPVTTPKLVVVRKCLIYRSRHNATSGQQNSWWSFLQWRQRCPRWHKDHDRGWGCFETKSISMTIKRSKTDQDVSD